jgi:O-antigen ligase
MATRSTGFLHWIFPIVLGVIAVTVLLSGRDLTQTATAIQAGIQAAVQPERHPAMIWVQRAASLLLLLISVERAAHYFTSREHLPAPVLTMAFAFYWLATIAMPAVFGSHKSLSHDYFYTLAIGLAALLVSTEGLDKVVGTCRNALFAFLLAGVLLIPLNASMVIDPSYAQGLLRGVPRLAGLAPHAVALGMFALTALLCLWYRPFKSRWLTAGGWLLGIFALFLAQSKNAWFAFFLCSLCMLAVRQGAGLWRRMGDPRQGAVGVVACVGTITIVLALMSFLLFGDVGEQADEFLNSAAGAQLMTLTGRDRIWAVAIEEWQSNPLFGYGPEIWGRQFRASIGMPNATNAHNQFMDTLARSGTVGAVALVLYAGVLLVMSVRHAKATRGFSLALFLAIALRSISEVPLLLLGYGTELFSHLLLIVTLASAAGARARVVPAGRTRSFYGVAS